MLLILLAGLDRSRWEPVLVHRPSPGIRLLVERAERLGARAWPIPQGKNQRDVWWLRQLAKHLKEERPSIFHAHRIAPLDCTYGLIAAALARVPVVVATQHLFSGSVPRWRVFQQKLVSATVDRYIAVSEEVARGLWSAGGAPRAKVQIIQNGIPLGPFNQANQAADPALKSMLRGNRDLPVVLCLARLHSQKGLSFLLEAAVSVPDARFVIAGDGPERNSLAAQSEALGLRDRVIFLGHRTDVPDLLAVCDLFVLPSLYEGLPVSILEAMAAGKPVIATAIGGTDEAVLDGETGLLVPPGDSDALAKAIQRLLADTSLANDMARAGRERAYGKFSAEQMVRRTVQVYEQLLASHGIRNAHA